jgi:Chlorophyll A-B binding protein
LVGDVGFDPCFLATKADLVGSYFKGITGGKGPSDGLVWFREAELMHGRICMMAVVGFIWPGLFGTFPGNEAVGLDAYSYTNPLEAWEKAPQGALIQILLFMIVLEFRRINNIIEDGESYIPGNAQRWGQFPGQWNPFGFNYTPEEYEEKALQEVKHSRLAMIGLLGLFFQASSSGVSVADQLGAAFVAPDYYAKAGYFLPEGI